MTGVARVAAALVAALLGAACVFAALFVHRSWWGCLLVWAVALVVQAALSPHWYGRAAFASGWVGLLSLGLQTRPEGDYLVAADVWGYLLLATVPVLLVGAVVGAFGGRGAARQRPPSPHEVAGLQDAS